MKANELMIGDWVAWCDNYYHGTGEKENIQLDRDEYIDLLCRCTSSKDLELGCEWEPIHLTEEILKLNGIDYESEVGIIKKIGGHIYIRGWMANCELYMGMIRYVHEFQHALRLCGLKELADNFKLEQQGIEENTPVAEGELKILDLCEDGSIKYEYRLNECLDQNTDRDMKVGDYVLCTPSNMLTKMGVRPRFDGKIVAVHPASYSVECFAGGKKLIVLELRKSDVFKVE